MLSLGTILEKYAKLYTSYALNCKYPNFCGLWIIIDIISASEDKSDRFPPTEILAM